MSDQQDQTKTYFDLSAGDWQNKSLNASGEYSVIKGRSDAVLDVIGRFYESGRFLDIGCGTGQLTIAVAQLGWRAEGVDFAPAMVAECEANARNAKVAASFVTGSFFDCAFDDETYDVISAQGFLEYISLEQCDTFFARACKMLRPGGALVIGSRNRLFNLFSLNAFTKQEIELGTMGGILAEAIGLQSAPTLDDALRELRRFGRTDAQPNLHPQTGIAVDTRYQFTPADLATRLARAGLTTRALYPVHYHAFPPVVAGENPELHSAVAHQAAKLGARDHRLVPGSSTFVIDAVKHKG